MNTIRQSENPWLGLKSYSEGKRLYGRDREIEELSQKILYNTQTVIYGKSGIGKSSLLKAGVFPILRRNGYFPVYVRFVHEAGQGSYTSQIKTAIDEALKCLKVEDLGAPEADVFQIVEGHKEELVPIHDVQSEESLWEYFHRHQFYYKLQDDNELHSIIPVLIFDQFEEIFTLQKNESLVKDFFDELAGLLNNVCPKYLLKSTVEVEHLSQSNTNSSLIKRGLVKSEKKWDYIDETNLHVVLSLREDFLSHLERNIEYIPSLKHNRYCLLPLNEDQAAEVIMQPLPGLISVEVAKEIICKVTGALINDFEIDDNPELEVDSAILSLFLSELFLRKGDALVISKELVDLFGTNIISDFYEKIVNDRTFISESSVHYLEKRLVTKEGRRDSIFKEQAMRNGVTEAELKYLHASRLLHLYPWRDGIRIEFSHDVLIDIVLRRRRFWEIEDKKKQEEEKYEYEKSLKNRVIREQAIKLGFVITFFLFFLGAFIYDGWYDVKIQRYASVVKEGTWMKGIMGVSEHDASYLPFHYVFYKSGRYACFPDSVEVRNGYNELTSEHSMTTYLVNHLDYTDNDADKIMLDRLQTVVKWVLSSDNKGKYCIQEEAFNKDGELIFSLKNSINNDSVFISTYVDEFGFPITMRDSNYIYLRTTLNANGHEILQEYFDDRGFPVMNKDKAFQTSKEYFANGIQKSEASLFLNGHRMIDRFGNCGWEVLELAENGIDNLLTVYFDEDREPCRLNDNVMFKRWEYDEYGRCIKETYWKIDDEYLDINVDSLKILFDEKNIELLPDTNKLGIHGYICEYNRHGKNTLYRTIGLDHKPKMASNSKFVELQRQYDDNGKMIKEIAVNEENQNVWEYFAEFSEDGEMLFNKSYTIDENLDTIMDCHLYWDKNKERKIEKKYNGDYYTYNEYDIKGNIRECSWYKTNSGEPASIPNGKHKTLYDYEYNKDLKQLMITETYFNKDGYFCGYEENYPYYKECMLVDSLLHTKSIIRYTTKNIKDFGVDTSETPIDIFFGGKELTYNKDFTVSLSEVSLDAHREKHRTYDNEAYYYQVKYVMSILPIHKDEIKGFYAVNEFGDPSLVRHGGELYSATWNGMKFDEYGNLIVEGTVIDRPLYAAIETKEKLGFMDGDILVQQDDWVLWKTSDESHLNGLDVEPTPTTCHHFKVLRYNERNNKYDVVEINIPKGDERVTEIEYVKLYVTKAEENRIYQTMSEKIYGKVFGFIPKENGAIYERGMRTHCLVLSINDWDMTQHFGGDRDSLINVMKSQTGHIKHVMVYDEDAKKVLTYEVDSDTLGVAIKSYSTTPRYYEFLKEQMLMHKNKIETSKK